MSPASFRCSSAKTARCSRQTPSDRRCGCRDAAAYAQSVVEIRAWRRFLGNYRYLLCDDEVGRVFLWTAAAVSLPSAAPFLPACRLALLGLAAVILLLILSKHCPTSGGGYEKQKVIHH